MSHASVETTRLVDWVSFSVDTSSLSELFAAVPGLSELLQGAREGDGRHNYRTGYYGNGCCIFMDGRVAGMGTLVQLSGRGCESLITDVQGFFSQVLAIAKNVTRVDLAHDIAGRSFEAIQGQLEAGNYTSRLRNYQYRAKGSKPGEHDLGRTMELGRRCSESFLRIYEACKMHTAAPEGTVRFELELKGDRAAAVARMLAAGDVDAAFGVVRSVLDFREPAVSDSNRARWSVSGWWSEAIGAAKTVLQTVKERMERTLDRGVEWTKRQCVPFLFAARKALGADVFNALIDQGEYRAARRYPSLMVAATSSG